MSDVASRELPHVLRSRRVLAGGRLEPADLVIADGIVGRIAGHGSVPAAEDVMIEDLGDLVVQPGLVDPHVHFNDPGRSDWEGFEHGTRAAAAGGITFVADMPLNSDPVTVDPASLRAKCAAAANRLFVDVGLHGGLVPLNAGDPAAIEALLESGALAIKVFLCDSGLREFPPLDRAALEPAMEVLADLGATLLVHAELPAPVLTLSQPRRYAAFLATRPPELEVRAIEMLVELSRRTGCRVHVVHLSTAYALPAIERAKSAGLPFTVETCPHYLSLCAEEIADGDTHSKCTPPIRGRDNRERLWAALHDGVIDLVASDHSPCPPGLKALHGEHGGDFGRAWGGISSLQLSLPLLWTGMRARDMGLERLGSWLSDAPARLLGLERTRGAIELGRRADLVVWNPEASFVVDADTLLHRHAVTPYHGHELYGVVSRTYLAGRCVYRDGEILGQASGAVVLGGAREKGAPSRTSEGGR
jgi:allantoinase